MSTIITLFFIITFLLIFKIISDGIKIHKLSTDMRALTISNSRVIGQIGVIVMKYIPTDDGSYLADFMLKEGFKFKDPLTDELIGTTKN